MAATQQQLNEFVGYCRQHFTGRERQDDKLFLNQFFKAFGHPDALSVGAEFEVPVNRGSRQGGKGYADLVWKDKVLFELKSKGENLEKHWQQVERYWMYLRPQPKYSILSNFDEFWIYDFCNQPEKPLDVVSLDELPERVSAFSFMASEKTKPIFRNNQVAVTDSAARQVGFLYRKILNRIQRTKSDSYKKEDVQRFILQCVLAMFSEDRKLLPQDMFIECVYECLGHPKYSYDILSGLFAAMNDPVPDNNGVTPAGRYTGVSYFNGGLFARIHPIELTEDELKDLAACARLKWEKVRPSIFGNIFESAIIEDDERRECGIHYTWEADIKKIVIPTIVEYWESLVDAADTEKELIQLQQKIINYKVLDPACGSGNFLYIAYQELKRVEQELLYKLRLKRGTQQMSMGYVTPGQFYGIDTNSFAVELARVTMMIGRKIAIDELELKDEPALPLDSLDKNIIREDALFAEWPKADAIVGNPPFLGGYRIRQELGDDYFEQVCQHFSGVKDKVDYCTYWFRLAHDRLREDGRAGLVGTNSVTQGLSRAASLEYILKENGYIHHAFSSQPWAGDAKVHVNIVNWSKEKPSQAYLDSSTVPVIHATLGSGADVLLAKRLNANSGKCYEGVKPTGKGFLISENQVKDWINSSSENRDVLKLYADATNLARMPSGAPSRWIIDFNDLSIEQASSYVKPFAWIKENVKPERDKNRRKATREYWWQYGEKRPGMRRQLEGLSQYFIIPAHSKWYIFLPAPLRWLPSNSTKVVTVDDFYILGLLTSNVHRQWTQAQSSTLKGDTRYTHNTCFETFPFPQDPLPLAVKQIRSTMTQLHAYRSEQMENKQWGITKLYNAFFDEPSSQLYKLHKHLDQLVMNAYGFNEHDDILENLLALNLELAEKEKNGESVVGPWDPTEREQIVALPNAASNLTNGYTDSARSR